MAAAAFAKVARAVAAAAAGTGTTLMWQWLPPDFRKAMKRSNATASLPCSKDTMLLHHSENCRRSIGLHEGLLDSCHAIVILDKLPVTTRLQR